MALTSIDHRVNAYFQQIFSTPPSDKVLNIFRKLHDSPVPHHKEIVCCMLEHLIKEFELFPSYPNKDLFKMANFVGGFVEHGLISDKNTLNTIIGYIFYDLKSAQNANAFNFSLAALNRFKMQLNNFPKLCYRLQKIEKFENFPPDLIEYVEYGIMGLRPPPRPVTVNDEHTSSSADNNEEVKGSRSPDCTVRHAESPSLSLRQEPPAMATAAVADGLPVPEPPAAITADVKMIVPSKVVQGKIRFLVNSMSKANLQTNCTEIKSIITEEHLPWLSKYIVTKRVRHEFNFHELYSNALDCFNSQVLDSLALSDTIKKINILLRRNVGIPSAADKWLIKNLGHWLGVITLAKNQPIPKEDIDLENLLADAYDKGEEELLFVVQLVTRILESCSMANFGPDHPWTISIINCLFGLYEKPNTDLRVKVEVEKMCKTLLNISSSKLIALIIQHPNIAKNIRTNCTMQLHISDKRSDVN